MAMVAALCVAGASCTVRGPTAAEAAHDGSIGATIGAMFGGPAGATIGSGLAIALGICVRAYEKSKLRERHADEKTELTQRFAQQLEGIATARTQAIAETRGYSASEALIRNPEVHPCRS